MCGVCGARHVHTRGGRTKQRAKRSTPSVTSPRSRQRSWHTCYAGQVREMRHDVSADFCNARRFRRGSECPRSLLLQKRRASQNVDGEFMVRSSFLACSKTHVSAAVAKVAMLRSVTITPLFALCALFAGAARTPPPHRTRRNLQNR